MPSWAALTSNGKVTIEAAKFYPEILEELWADEDWPEEEKGLYEGLQRGKIDAYWLEVAFQVAKMDIQSAISGTASMPEKGGALLITVSDSTKAENGVSIYAQATAEKGRGAEAASKGREAREHYKRIRAVLF